MRVLNELLVVSVLAGSLFTTLLAEGTSKFVAISKGVKSIEMNLNGEKFTLMRNQTSGNKISPLYETTTNGIPQPIILAEGIETVGEREFIEYMIEAQEDDSIVIVDSRTPGWHARIRIPGSINMPYTGFKNEEDAIDMLEDEFDVVIKDGKFDFSEAKTIVAYCNGYWCAQTPTMIKRAEYSLLNMGYPTEKIKYYRGGMQAWTSMGFTTLSDDE